MHLLDILHREGFRIYQGKHLDYSSMRNEGLDSRYKKGDKVFVWGLCEKGKPPTLVYPRPNIRKTITKKAKDWDDCSTKWGLTENPEEAVTMTLNERYADLVNECLQIFDHEDIYKAIMKNLNVIFDLNLKKIVSH